MDRIVQQLSMLKVLIVTWLNKQAITYLSQTYCANLHIYVT